MAERIDPISQEIIIKGMEKHELDLKSQFENLYKRWLDKGETNNQLTKNLVDALAKANVKFNDINSEYIDKVNQSYSEFVKNSKK